MGSNWTISAWFTAPLNDTGVILRHSLAAAAVDDRHITFDQAGGRQLGVYKSGNGNFQGSGFFGNTLANGWRHLVAVGSVNKTIFYVDGINVGESSLIAGTQVEVIGNTLGGSERFADKIDEFRIYSRSLSAFEISELYGNGDGDFGGHPYQDGPPTFDNRPSVQLPIMPLAHWTFDEDNGTLLPDASGNGNIGTLQNFADLTSARVAGRAGLGLKFDGVDDNAWNNAQTAFNLGGPFAITFWAKTSDLSADLLKSGQIIVEANDGFARARAHISGSWVNTSLVPFIMDEWNHYCVSYDGTKLRLYLNRVEAASVSAVGPLTWEGLNYFMYLGGMPGSGRMTEGEFDDFRIFGRALTLIELDDIYNLSDSALVARYGTDYSYQIAATKGPIDFNATNLPPGLVVDYSTGIISGKPEATGSFNVEVTVANASGQDSEIITLQVLRGRQSITFDQTLAGLRYGVTPIDLNASATSGLPVTFQVVSGSLAVDLVGNNMTVKGPGMVGIRVTQPGDNNWFPAEPVLRQIQIGKAELIVQAHNQFRKTGIANPALTYTLSGFVNGENASVITGTVIVTTPATPASAAGDYPLTPSGATAANYFFTYLDGILTVSDKKSQSLVFDQNLTNVAADSLPFVLLGRSIDEDGNATDLPLRYQIENPNVARLKVTAQENLQAYWKFDEELYNSVRDELGNYDGTLVGLAGTGANKAWITGKFGNSINLNPPSGYAHLGGVPISGDFTVSLWVRSDDVTIDGGVILAKDNIPSMKVFRIEQDASDGHVKVVFHKDGGTETVSLTSSSPVLTNDKWTHLALAYRENNATLTLYAEGNKTSEITDANLSGSTLSSRLSDLRLGDPSGSVQGRVDDLRIYGTSLSDSEIYTIYGQAGGDFDNIEIIGAGTTKITAHQAGDDTYAAALPVDNYLTVVKVAQSISFTSIIDHSVGDFPFTIDANSSSGLPVIFATSDAAIATVNGNTVSVHGPGLVTITALQLGDSRYETATTATQSFTVGYGNLFRDSTPGLKLWFDGNDVNADQYRDEPTDFLPGNRISLWGDKSGNTNNPIQGTSSSMPVWQPDSLNEKAVVKFDQSESFDIGSAVPSARVIFLVHRQEGAGSTQVLGGDIGTTDPDGFFGLHRDTAGLNIVSDVDSSTWSVNALRVTPGSQSLWIDGEVIGSGGINSEVDAFDKVGNGFSGEIAEALVYDQPVNSVNRKKIEGYLAHKWGLADSLASEHPFSSTPPAFGGAQTITFPTLVDKAVGDPSFPLSAFASSGLPVSYVSSNPNVAIVSSNIVTIVGAGTTTITAMQVGDDRYDPAHPVSLELHVIPPVTKDDQSITFVPIPEQTRDDPPFELNATAVSTGIHHPVFHLPVTFSINYGPATVDPAGIVTLDGVAGEISVTASQSGSAYVNPAPNITQIFQVTAKQRQEIRFPALGEKGGIRDLPMSHRAFLLQGVYSSGGVPLQIMSSNSSIVRVAGGNRLVPVGVGTVTLTIEAPGNALFVPADPVTSQLEVIEPSKEAWRLLRRGDVRYDGTRERFVRRLMARDPVLSLSDAQKIFDEDYSDSDGDGFSNLFERATGSDSLGPDNWKNLPFRPRLIGGNQAISFIQFKSPLATAGEEFQYHVERSEGLRTWNNNGVSLKRTVDLGGGMERVVYETDAPLPSGGLRFLRLRITTP